MHIITTLSPVLVMILLGYLLRRYDFFSQRTVRDLSSLVYWVGLPCLLFYQLSTSSFHFADCGRVYAVLVISMAGCILAAYLLSILFRIPAGSVTAVVQGAFRGNLAFIGLPVLMYSFSGAPAEVSASVQVTAVLVLGLMVLTNNVAAVFVFLAGRQAFSIKAVGKIAFGIVSNPLLISTAAGLAAGALIRSLPVVLDRTLSGISQMVLPLALISVGAAIAGQKINRHLLPAGLATFIKLGLGPVLGYLAVRFLIPLDAEHLRLAMIFMACPTAAASYVLADQLGGDHELTASIVVLTSVLSVVSLSAAVGLFS